ncbi:MAG: xanthine dehydrogenase family protein molybdopterin-binding subunit [Bacteroidota bacterium]|nr:xanthine dehydrogenase family protein molybdopterin-binding subunit [Bacteroidota bacterium]
MKNLKNISRRSFIRTSGLVGGGLIISFMIPAYSGRKRTIFDNDEGESVFIPNAFLQVGSDNTIKVLLAHTEMGQGIWTTLTMLIAEELDADWKNIIVEHAPADKAYGHTAWGIQATGGSSTTWSEFDRYRKAGAAARILLVQAAAKKWGLPASACKTENGFVFSGNKKLSYGQLADSAATLPPLTDIPLRTKEQWKYIGKGIKRLDAPAKVNGKALFGIDVQFEGLLTAVVAHPPVFGGKVKSFDDSKTKLVKGVVQVVKIPNGIAVIAQNFWTALQGKKALQVEWDPGENINVDSITQLANFKKLADTDGKSVAKAGDVPTAMKQAAKIIEAEYTFPYLAHATMEPLNCTIKVDGDKCDIWTGTQAPGMEQAAAAKILGLKQEQVKVHTMFLGGGFGRRGNPDTDFVSEAAQIAKASGKPIKMVWTREDDMQAAYYRPSFLHRATIGTDTNGMPLAWHHIAVGQTLVGDPEAGASTEGISDSPYLNAIPNYYVGLHSPKINIPVLWFRSVGNTHTAFVMETLMDELAHNAGKDPVEYRRRLLKGKERNLKVLNTVAEKAGWGKPLPKGHFHGVAMHESFGSYAAEVAEVSLDENGLVKVHKVTIAIDCGLAVNPDGIKAQMESCVNFGLSATLYSVISFKNGVVQQTNFDDYRVLRLNESPAEIEVHIVESTEKMGGIGEPGMPPVAPAVANAVFAACGKRIRQLPFGEINFKA